jgi:hypothetical protein
MRKENSSHTSAMLVKKRTTIIQATGDKTFDLPLRPRNKNPKFPIETSLFSKIEKISKVKIRGQNEECQSAFLYQNKYPFQGFSSKLNSCFTLVSCLAYSSSLKMEGTYSSETSVDFQRAARRYIPEDGTLHIEYLIGHSLHHDNAPSRIAFRMFGKQKNTSVGASIVLS